MLRERTFDRLLMILRVLRQQHTLIIIDKIVTLRNHCSSSAIRHRDQITGDNQSYPFYCNVLTCWDNRRSGHVKSNDKLKKRKYEELMQES